MFWRLMLIIASVSINLYYFSLPDSKRHNNFIASLFEAFVFLLDIGIIIVLIIWGIYWLSKAIKMFNDWLDNL